MNNTIILGRVCDTWSAGTQDVALLEPLYMRDDEIGDWIAITDPERQFPNRGRVTWFNAPDEAVVGTIWQFVYEQNPTFNLSNPRHDLAVR